MSWKEGWVDGIILGSGHGPEPEPERRRGREPSRGCEPRRDRRRRRDCGRESPGRESRYACDRGSRHVCRRDSANLSPAMTLEDGREWAAGTSKFQFHHQHGYPT
jgi:hypothetical protein